MNPNRKETILKPLLVQSLGVELVRVIRPLLGRCDAGLADQLRRASNSMVLNIAEARGRAGRDRKNRLRIARGSALEVHAALELAEAWRLVSHPADAHAILDRIAAMLWKLTR